MTEEAPKLKKVMSKNGRVYYKRKENGYVDSDTYPLDPAKCGRRSNYMAHRARAEWPCDPCREANRQYHTHWRALKRLKKQVAELRAQAQANIIYLNKIIAEGNKNECRPEESEELSA